MTDKPSGGRLMTAGIISDTHGRLSKQAKQALKGVDSIIHAGDIGTPEILAELKGIAPVFAVRGNMDFGDWARALPKTDVVELGEATVYVLHDLYDLDLDPRTAGFQAVVNGHTHRMAANRKNGVLYVNPGSATMPKHGFPASVAMLRVQGKSLEVEFVDLEP